MTNNGCYKCQDRKPLCHSSCEKYKAWKEAHEAKKEAIKTEKDKRNELDSVAIEARIKAKRRAGKMR
jgi:hypothetical protein